MNTNKMIDMFNENERLFALADYIVENGLDTYAYVASKIFNKKYEECMDRNPVSMEFSVTGNILRTIAKKICINSMSVDELSTNYSIPQLKQLIVNAFPFRFPEDIVDGEDTATDDIDERICGSTTFLVNLTGYVRFKYLMRDNKRHTDRVLDHKEATK